MPKMHVFKRVYVTLLEMLLVLAIIALIGGALVYNINNALIDQKFRTEVSRVVDELRLAQDLMLIFGTDVHVRFAQDGKSGIKYWIVMETALPRLDKEIKRRHKNLTAIRGVFLNDLASKEFIKGQLDIKFLSKGSLMSRGIMRLATSSLDTPPPGTLENYICLPGYPHPIYSTEQKESDPSCNINEDPIEEQRLTLSTVEKLPAEKLKQTEQKDETPPK